MSVEGGTPVKKAAERLCCWEEREGRGDGEGGEGKGEGRRRGEEGRQRIARGLDGGEAYDKVEETNTGEILPPRKREKSQLRRSALPLVSNSSEG